MSLLCINDVKDYCKKHHISLDNTYIGVKVKGNEDTFVYCNYFYSMYALNYLTYDKPDGDVYFKLQFSDKHDKKYKYCTIKDFLYYLEAVGAGYFYFDVYTPYIYYSNIERESVHSTDLKLEYKKGNTFELDFLYFTY